VKQWHEKRQKWCDYVQRLPEDLIFIHVFKETPPATILSRVGHKITSLSLIYSSHPRYAFHPYSARVSSIVFSHCSQSLAVLLDSTHSLAISLNTFLGNIPPLPPSPPLSSHFPNHILQTTTRAYLIYAHPMPCAACVCEFKTFSRSIQT